MDMRAISVRADRKVLAYVAEEVQVADARHPIETVDHDRVNESFNLRPDAQRIKLHVDRVQQLALLTLTAGVSTRHVGNLNDTTVMVTCRTLGRRLIGCEVTAGRRELDANRLSRLSTKGRT